MRDNRYVEWLVEHKKPVLIGVGVFLLIITIGFIVFGGSSEEAVEEPEVVAQVEEPPKPVLVASPLTGVEVRPDLSERPVTAFVIENSPDARPQSGLKEAGLVFEAIAEGGITRFIAFYQEAQPELIGPVRSLRPYFVDMVRTFDASIGHVGGSATAQAEVQQFGLKDLDQFYNSGAYWRSSDRFAPHNVYTAFDRINALNESKGFTSSEFTPLARQEPAPISPATADSITIEVSSYLYQVEYDYEPEKNYYKRIMAGQAHDDREKGQITPSVVVALKVPNSIVDGFRYSYALVGSGEGYIFQNGDVTKVTWSRGDRGAQFVFKDQNDMEVKLNPGQVWITAVSPDKNIDWNP